VCAPISRVDEYIGRLPDWQQAVGQQVAGWCKPQVCKSRECGYLVLRACGAMSGSAAPRRRGTGINP